MPFPTPTDPVRIALNGTLLGLFLLYFLPGGIYLQRVELQVFGWPFFALWVVVIGPALALLVFLVNSVRNVRRDVRRDAAGGET